jgi:hypothetical protein
MGEEITENQVRPGAAKNGLCLWEGEVLRRNEDVKSALAKKTFTQSETYLEIITKGI